MNDQATFDRGGSLPSGSSEVRNSTGAPISVTAGTYDGTFANGRLVLTPVDPNQAHAEDEHCWCGPTVETFG